MSWWVWALIAFTVAMFVASEVVHRVLKHRIAQKEAAFEHDFSAQVDEELPRFLDEESE